MVGFTTRPNMPGASKEMDALKAELQKVEDLVRSNLEELASVLIPLLETEFTDLVAITRVMIPALPSLPSINLQAEIANLAALLPQSGEYAAQLASIKDSFGSAIEAGGYDLNPSIVSDAISALAGATGSLTAAIPNMELPFGAIEAIEIPKEALQPIKDALGEIPSSFSTGDLFNTITGLVGDGPARDALEESMKNLESAAETVTNNFGNKAKRLTTEFEIVQAAERDTNR